ncbi:MAG: AraC family transcriptional regulator [Saprospiraceae bacterium]
MEPYKVPTHKPALEKILPQLGSSIAYKRFSDEKPNGEAMWHYHPEVELVYIDKGSGKRHVGNNISYYNNGEVILLGPNLPHYGFTDRLTDNNKEIVIHFLKDILGDKFFAMPEMRNIEALLERSKQGLSFKGQTKIEVAEILDKMEDMNHFDRMIGLINVLQVLAKSKEYEILNASAVTIETDPKSNERIKTVYDHVRANFQRTITLDEIASLSNMTVPSFCRYFKKLTGKTFTQFVNEFRISHACKLLAETPYTIAHISYECGYNNFSHFNKHFKLYTKKNPSAYRDEFRKVVN